MSASPPNVDTKTPIEVLVHFSHLLATTDAPDEILGLLARAAVDHLGADGAGVLEIAGDEAHLVAAAGLPVASPAAHPSPSFEVETIGPELGDRLLAAWHLPDGVAHTLPLVSGGDLFGVLVLVCATGHRHHLAELQLGQALVDLAATALSKAHRLAQLERAYAELEASRDVLVRTEKLRALGEMSTGVAHDLKNILTPLILAVTQLKRNPDVPKATLEMVLGSMDRVLVRGLQTVDRLRLFGHQSADSPAQAVDVDALVDEAVHMANGHIKPGQMARIVTERGAPPLIRVQPSELVAALVNLLVNALHAIGGAGRVTVTTRAAAGGAEILVADTGPGMTAEVRERVFQPFFTTKGREGTGLGLAMVYALVQRSHGLIHLDSEPGEGATFTLWFPAAEPPAA